MVKLKGKRQGKMVTAGAVIDLGLQVMNEEASSKNPMTSCTTRPASRISVRKERSVLCMMKYFGYFRLQILFLER